MTPLEDPPGSPAELEVVAVRHHLHRAALRRPFVTAARRTESVDYLVVEVELADGSVGQGSAAETLAVTGESIRSMSAALAGPLAAAVRGRRGSLPELTGTLPAAALETPVARAALDVALHDAWARSRGQPLVTLLGGSPDQQMPDDMTVSLEDPEAMALRAREAAASGYAILKIKLGRDGELDRRRLRAVASAAPGARLRLDANQGWSVEEAIRVLDSLAAEGLPVDLVEQPVAADDLAGMARVRAATEIPVMADESVRTLADARRVVEAGAADLLNIKLAKTGGIAEAMAIADLAAEAGLRCMVGAMMEPRISITAAAHVAFAHPAITLIDLDPPAWFASDRPAGGIQQRAGTLRLCGGPGLGLDRMPETTDVPGGAPVTP